MLSKHVLQYTTIMKIILFLFVVASINFVVCTTPPKPKCPPNEHFETQSIRCQITCNNMALEPYMGPCYPSDSCFCNGNMVRNAKGICIERCDCPNDPEKCGPNEEYAKCGTACPDTCDNYKDTCKVCTDQCVPGCFCKKGFIRDRYGKCVEPKDCPKTVCDKPHEHYDWCPPTCPPGDGCNLIWSKFNCTGASKCCTAACRCDSGHFRNNDGICVTAEQCQTKGQCADHSHYDGCINCPKNTECFVPCEGGCACDEGYVADKNRVCVKKDTECGKHAHYDKCPPTNCPPGKLCPAVCVPACVCDAGYVKNSKGECVKIEDSCGKNEHYDPCINRCPPLPKGVQCKIVCKGGCVCNEGYKKDKNGKCIKDIPPPKCGPNEEYKECGTACPDTCDNYNNTCKVCTLQCVSGCFCKKGYIRDRNGNCIEPKKCPKPVCDKPHEHYDWCPPTCPPGDNCSLLWSKFNCTGASRCCTGKCRCDPGYYRNGKGICVTAKQCQTNGQCGDHSHYDDCINCPKGALCIVPCEGGCACDEGYEADKNGVCVKKGTECGKHAHYDKCPPTNCPPGKLCPAVCVPACVCDAGYVKNSKGECVKNEHPCGENEHYDPCINRCPPLPKGAQCKIVCKGGCVCNEGYKKDKNGKCIKDIPMCPKNEEYNPCGSACPDTCDNYNDTCRVCTKQCVPGCFCKKGLVRDANNNCVKPKECPKVVCNKPHEHYDSCPPNCPAGDGCDLLWSKFDCTGVAKCCKPACRCDPGYYRNNDGICVTAEQCQTEGQCADNSHYDSCINPCPPDKKCPIPCIGGCVCDEGYVEDENHICIEENPEECGENAYYENCDGCDEDDDCEKGCVCYDGYDWDGYKCVLTPPPCPPNQTYVSCAFNCPTDNCPESNGPVPQCSPPYPCPPGCRCKPGYLKNYQGECILKEDCPPPVICGDNEHYERCGTACPATCDNPSPKVCTKQCVRGCFCNSGLVRNERGECVPEDQCPPKCGKNEIGTICFSSCPSDYCKKPGDPVVLCKPAPCPPYRKGCRCKDGYKRKSTKNNTCVPIEDCKCGENSHYDKCPPIHCKPGMACAQVCRPACVCDKGYKFDKDGKCVKIVDHQCPKNEEYKECGTACPKTCKNKDVEINCIAVCKSGCFCKGNLVRNDDGVCVDPSKCPPPPCPTNQTYVSCVIECPTDYCPKSNGPVPQCLPQNPCPPGCKCKPGYLKNDWDECILKEDCPPPVICSENEHYEQCGTACPATCDNPSPSLKDCPQVCVPGCFCNSGLLRNKNGECVPKYQCTPPPCPPNQTYVSCAFDCPSDNCPKSNGPVPQCLPPHPCPSGCRCKPGYLKNIWDECILKEDCPPPVICSENEHYEQCGTACPATCDNPSPSLKDCPQVCVPGCFCNSGLLRNKNGECVPKDQCPPKCGKNEEPTDCFFSCPSDYCRKPGDPIILCKPAPCPPYRCGCRCKDGYKRNNEEDEICIPEEDCPCNEDGGYATATSFASAGTGTAYATATATVTK